MSLTASHYFSDEVGGDINEVEFIFKFCVRKCADIWKIGIENFLDDRISVKDAFKMQDRIVDVNFSQLQKSSLMWFHIPYCN